MGAMAWPLKVYLMRSLAQAMEVAVEYWMALNGSSHVRFDI